MLTMLMAAVALGAGALSLDSTYWQSAISVPLWPNGAPNDNGLDYTKLSTIWSWNYPPAIHVFNLPRAAKPTRAVLVLPGGAYHGLAIYHEGLQWRDFFGREGIATIVVAYRTPCGHHEIPAGDVYQAVRLVKAHAAEWNIDTTQIGVMGFSAGGHLASTVATHATADVRPAFQILMYPVISMDPAVSHGGSRLNLLGKNPSPELVRYYCNEQQVTARTPRAFLALAADDRAVPPMNSALYYNALLQHKVPAVMHVYPSGGHGFGINVSFRYHEALLRDLSDWLHSF